MKSTAKITIDSSELETLRAKAKRWDDFCKKQASHLNSGTKAERSERARKAVQARWSKVKK